MTGRTMYDRFPPAPDGTGDFKDRIEAALGRSLPPPPLDWESLALEDPPERDWAIKYWLGMGHVTLLAGQGGIGKTLLAQQVATALGLGRNFIDGVPIPRRVLMWCCEDDKDELWRRQVAICEHFGITLLDLIGKLFIVPRAGLENLLFTKALGTTAWTPLWTELEQQVNDLQADVLILDNVAQATTEETDRAAVSRFVNGFQGIKPGLATLLLAHPAKALGSEYSGSTAWENAVRARWYLGSKLPDQQADADEAPDDSVRYLCRRKANYSSKDYLKFNYQNGVLVPDTLDGTPRFDATARADLAEAVILKCIPRLTEMGHFPGKARNSDDYLPKLLVNYKFNQGLPKKELEAAMRNLMVRGMIAMSTLGQYPNRSPRMGLAVVGA